MNSGFKIQYYWILYDIHVKIVNTDQRVPILPHTAHMSEQIVQPLGVC
jgi:hypothetical protein